jgi:hypothetical protein
MQGLGVTNEVNTQNNPTNNIGQGGIHHSFKKPG